MRGWNSSISIQARKPRTKTARRSTRSPMKRGRSHNDEFSLRKTEKGPTRPFFRSGYVAAQKKKYQSAKTTTNGTPIIHKISARNIAIVLSVAFG